MTTDIPVITGALKKEIGTLEGWTKTVAVRNPVERKAVYEAVIGVKTKRAQIVESFKVSKESTYAAWKSVVAHEKSFTDKLDDFEKAGKKAILQFDAIEEKRIEDERKKQQAIADENARKERERLLKKAETLKTPEKKEAALAAAASVQAPVIEIAPTVQKQAGESTRQIWYAEIINPSLVPREYLMVNEKMLDGIAKNSKGAMQIPGVVFKFRTVMAVR